MRYTPYASYPANHGLKIRQSTIVSPLAKYSPIAPQAPPVRSHPTGLVRENTINTMNLLFSKTQPRKTKDYCVADRWSVTKSVPVVFQNVHDLCNHVASTGNANYSNVQYIERIFPVTANCQVPREKQRQVR